MKKYILALICSCFFIGGESAFGDKAQRWEYAQFSVSPGIPLFAWTSPTESVSASSWQDFAKKYVHPFKMGSNYLTSVLNAVGADGWELCNYSDETGKRAIPAEVWLFKRSISP